MTELFLVNYKVKNKGDRKDYIPESVNDGDWMCFTHTHSLATAHDVAKGMREAGHEVNVQSVLIGENGKVEV